MSRKSVSSGAPWESIVGYARAVRIGNIIEVSGTTAVENGKVLFAGNAAAQTRLVLQKIIHALNELGADKHNIIRTRMYVADISRWEEIGKVHGEFFADVPPATSMVEVSRLIDPEILVEIEATAVLEAITESRH